MMFCSCRCLDHDGPPRLPRWLQPHRRERPLQQSRLRPGVAVATPAGLVRLDATGGLECRTWVLFKVIFHGYVSHNQMVLKSIIPYYSIMFHYWVLFKVIFYFPNRKSTMTGESIQWRFCIFWKPRISKSKEHNQLHHYRLSEAMGTGYWWILWVFRARRCGKMWKNPWVFLLNQH